MTTQARPSRASTAGRRRARAWGRVARGVLTAVPYLLVPGCSGKASRNALAAGGVVVHGAFAPEPLDAGDSAGTTMAVYFVVENSGAADTLDTIDTPVAAHAAVHSEAQHGGMVMMMSEPAVEIPAHGALRLAPGVRHVMLEGLAAHPRAGDTIRVVLHLRRAGAVRVSVPVIRYASLDSAVGASAR